MFIITIVKAIRKRNVRKSLIGTIILFIVGFISFICIGIFASNDSEINESNNSSHAEKSENQSKNKVAKEESKSKNSEQQRENKDNNTKQVNKDVEKPDQHKEKETHKPKPGTTDRIPVELSSTGDGDTAKFIYDGNVQSFRFLLIDTPETKHPRLGTQPFGQESSDRTAELLNNANKIEVEFDVGQKQDKYNRHLAYIYVDGEMLNNILVREGLAKVSYVYPPNTRYLTELESSQEKAKSEQIGIWSVDSAFEKEDKVESNSQNKVDNESHHGSSNDDNTNTTIENDSTNDVSNSTEQNSKSFPNCTALREVYPNGVPQGHSAYEPKHDRDKDGYACEVN
ncbi:DNA-binding protein [Staphylococcus succinus]|nr:DNA-binding protein [Staphylococcus succinus]